MVIQTDVYHLLGFIAAEFTGSKRRQGVCVSSPSSSPDHTAVTLQWCWGA